MNKLIIKKALITFQILQLYKNKSMVIKNVIIHSVEWVISMIFFNRFSSCRNLLRKFWCNYKLIMDFFSHLHSSKTISINFLKSIRSSRLEVFFKRKIGKHLCHRGFKLSLVSRLGLRGPKNLKVSNSRTPENGPICQILLCS